MKDNLDNFEILNARIMELYELTQQFVKKQESIVNSIFEEASELKSQHDKEVAIAESSLEEMGKNLERMQTHLDISNLEIKDLKDELNDPIRQLVRRAKFSSEE